MASVDKHRNAYQTWRRANGNLVQKTPWCKVSDCDAPGIALGLCSKHYQRYRRFGNPLHINLNAERRPGIARRTFSSDGYVKWLICKDKKKWVIAEHRLLMERHLGRPLTADETVHHKNGLRDDNRLENLEVRVGYHGKGATHCRHCGGAL